MSLIKSKKSCSFFSEELQLDGAAIFIDAIIIIMTNADIKVFVISECWLKPKLPAGPS